MSDMIQQSVVDKHLEGNGRCFDRLFYQLFSIIYVTVFHCCLFKVLCFVEDDSVVVHKCLLTYKLGSSFYLSDGYTVKATRL